MKTEDVKKEQELNEEELDNVSGGIGQPEPGQLRQNPIE